MRMVAHQSSATARKKQTYEKDRMLVREGPNNQIHSRRSTGYSGTFAEKNCSFPWMAHAAEVNPWPKCQRIAGSESMTSSPQGIGDIVAVNKLIEKKIKRPMNTRGASHQGACEEGAENAFNIYSLT
jgi:hypothetical protein